MTNHRERAQEHGQERRPSLVHWQVRIFGITWIAYAAFYLTRQALSAAKRGILDDPVASEALTKEMLGNLDTASPTRYSRVSDASGRASGDSPGTASTRNS